MNEHYKAAEEEYLYWEMQGQELKGIEEAEKIEEKERAEKQRVKENTKKRLIKECNNNPWLADDFYPLHDYSYSFTEINTIKDLFEYFKQGNRPIRAVVLFDNFAFVNQVNGGDEWLALIDDTEQWKTFESISFEYIASESYAEFENYINQLRKEYQ